MALGLETLIDHLWVPVLGALGYSIKRRDKKIDDLEKSHDDLKLHLAENYVRHEHLKDLKDDLREIKHDIKELIKGK